MRKYLFYLLLLSSLSLTNAQTVVWSDNFNDENISDWTRYDVDGDGFQWGDIFQVTNTGGVPVSTVALISRSWQQIPLTPDNWVVSPGINLTGITGTVTLKWKVQAAAAAWDQENYSVYVATTSDMASLVASPVTFTEIYNDPANAGTQYSRSLDISTFAGQTVYVAFRHHDVTDMDWISIDDVSVEAETGEEEPTEWSCDLEAELADPTLGGPVWDRVTATGTIPAFGGTDVSYHVYGPFTVDTDGAYVFYSDQSYDTADEWDGFLLLYHTEFDPANGTVNFVAGNDDATGTGLGTSGFTTNLTQGTEYFLVTTAYGSDDFGPFVNTITGAGTVTCGTEEPVDEYCIPEGTNTARFINNFSTTGGTENISNLASGFSTGGYGDFSATHAVTQAAGQSINFTADISGGTAGFRVWVDWNSDGTFDTIEEVVYQSTGYASSQNGSVNIPSDVVEGAYRMRVVSHWFSTTGDVDPCETGFTYGEFEDYTLNVTEGGEEPVDDCNQEVLSNNLQNGSTLGGVNNQKVAIDFTVEEGVTFTLTGVEPTVLLNAGGDATTFNFVFYTNDGGYPGTEIDQIPGTIISSTLTGNNFGFDFVRYVVELNEDIEFTEGTYWMELQSDALYWESTTATILGSSMAYFHNNTGGVWYHPEQNPTGVPTEMVYKLVGTCDATEEPGGDNDDCENAIALSCGDSVTGSTTDATDSGGNAAPDVFYSYTGNGVEEEVTVSLCGSGYDTLVRVFADCTLTEEIAINDDSDNCDGLQSEVTFVSDGTSTYVILVEGYAGFGTPASGDFVLNISCEEIVPPTEYCEPVLDCTDGDLITNVTFAGIDNDSACSPDGYGDYTSMMANVEAGSTNPISVTVGSGFSSESVSVWIDYNNNLLFEEDEFTYVGTGSGSDVTGDIVIPAGTPDGQYRMRVRVAAVGSALATWDLACDEEQVYGETEDYTLVVGEVLPPNQDCDQGDDSNGFENGLQIGTGTDFRNADDFMVSAGNTLNVQAIEINVISMGGPVDAIDFTFYNDVAGAPGTTVVASVTDLVPVSQEVIGTAFGFDVIRIIADVDLNFTGGTTGTTYWMHPTATAAGGGIGGVFWEISTVGTLGSPIHTSELNGPWTANVDGADAVFKLYCDDLGVSEMTSYQFSYYPNPVKDELNITSQKVVQNVTVYNLAGQQVSTQKLNVNNGKVSTSSLAPGVYVFRAVLEGGQVETFKVIKK